MIEYTRWENCPIKIDHPFGILSLDTHTNEDREVAATTSKEANDAALRLLLQRSVVNP